MKTTLTLLLTILSLQMFAQGMQIQWKQCFGGSDSESVFDLVSTPGGYLIAGVTSSDDGTISYNHGGSDAWIVKINKNGEFMWEKTFGGSDGDTFHRIFKCGDNSYYAIGSSSSEDGDVSYDPYPDNSDLWIVKIDSSGNILWDKIAGGIGDDIVHSGKVTGDGGIVILAKTASDNGDVSVHFGLFDYWIVKLSPEGDIEWDFTFGSDSQDEVGDILLTDDGGYVISGATFMTGGGNVNCESHGWYDAIAVKLDSSRNIEWQQCYGGSEGDIFIESLRTTGGYLFAGMTYSYDGQVTQNHGDGDLWVVRTDSIGNLIWQRSYGGANHEYPGRIFETNAGYAIIGSTTSYDGDVSGNHGIGEHEYDIWILNLDFNGEIISQQCFGGSHSEGIYWGAVRKNDHDYIVATDTDRGPSFDVQCDVTVYTAPDWWVFEAKDTTVGINSYNSNAMKLEVYPNPANEFVRFDYDLNPAIKNPNLKIFNLHGVVLAEVPLKSTSGVEIWDCSSVAPGMYFYQISQEGQPLSQGKILISD